MIVDKDGKPFKQKRWAANELAERIASAPNPALEKLAEIQRVEAVRASCGAKEPSKPIKFCLSFDIKGAKG